MNGFLMQLEINFKYILDKKMKRRVQWLIFMNKKISLFFYTLHVCTTVRVLKSGCGLYTETDLSCKRGVRIIHRCGLYTGKDGISSS